MNFKNSIRTLELPKNLNRNKTVISFIVATLCLVAAIFAFAPITNAIGLSLYTVRPSDVLPISDAATGPAGWYATNVGSATAQPTNTTPYNVAGSAEFNVGDASSYAELGLYKQLSSNSLTSLQNLSYATWQQADNTKAVSLQIGVDTDITDADTSWQGRLVFEPYLNTDFYNNQVTDGIWQTWLTNRPTAQWWMTWSPSLTTKYGANPCPQSDPCAYSDVLSQFPNIGFNAGFGNPLILKAGSGWSSFNGFADVPTVGTATDQEIWDFEPMAIVSPVYPTSKEQCFKNGWQAFGATFKNQGACVSYVAKNQ